jgi:branched-chain amino acid transport system ATP-binding protein
MLSLDGVEVVYNRVALVLKGVSIQVPEGKIVAILGSNGAGKSTTLKAISGLLRSERGEIARGRISWRGGGGSQPSPPPPPPPAVVRSGIVQVLEGRHVFEHLTVEENLLVGGYALRSFRRAQNELELVYEHFKQLRDLRRKQAGYLSGGEQQQLVIGRALMARPQVVLLDEPSLGLAPVRVAEVFEIIRNLNREEGMTFLLVEQNAEAALAIADYGYVLEDGRVVLDGDGETLRQNEDISEFYLGLSGVGERRSYRDVKSYRRRKRWLG